MKVTILCALVLLAALFCMLWAAVALVQSKKLFTRSPRSGLAFAHQVPLFSALLPGDRGLRWVSPVWFQPEGTADPDRAVCRCVLAVGVGLHAAVNEKTGEQV